MFSLTILHMQLIIFIKQSFLDSSDIGETSFEGYHIPALSH